MATKKQVIIGCSIAAVAFLLLGLILLGSCVYYVSQSPKDVSFQIQNASEARVGQEFDLVITVTNDRRSRAFKLSDIDLAEEYLKGFVVVSTDPVHKASSHVPISNSQSFNFDVSIPAKESRTFKFRLRPVSKGVFKGDVDVCEGLQLITKTAETEVK